jgi:cation transport regulator ChaB
VKFDTKFNLRYYIKVISINKFYVDTAKMLEIYMLYESIDDLPEYIKSKFPLYAQEVYVGVFNKAWEEYGDPHVNLLGASREQIAHKLALAAASKAYNDNEEDTWVENVEEM